MNINKDDEIIQKISDETGVKYSEEQVKILKHRGGMCILACAGSGKALKNGTGVLTPNGYVPIETLKIGDIIYGVDGKEQRVEGVYPQGKKEVYRVEFSDDSVIECCKDHLWTYQTYNMRRTTKKWKTDTLEHIMNNVSISVYPHTNKRGESHNRANIYIPMSEAIEFGEKQLPIMPYALGALLGDGCLREHNGSCAYSFFNLDYQIVDRVISELSLLNAELVADSTNPGNYRIRVGFGSDGSRKGLLRDILGDLGLNSTNSHDKFIPNIYKYSSVDDRLDLLRGIIDTDGHCNGTSYEITLASEKLIDDIKFVVESLGMTAVKTEKIATCSSVTNGKSPYSVVYRLYIKASDAIQKLHWTTQKDVNWREGQTSARRTITNIQSNGKFEEMTCIKVSNSDGLFVTENCIVTHNTTVLTHLIAKRIRSGEITDPNKLLCTTYSKAGATEMETRLNALLKRLGINSKITVKTLHATYYAILKHFGISGEVCTKRLTYIAEACRDAKVQLGDEDLMLIDSLLSYQVNNLLSDQELLNSYVYTLDNVTLNQFTEIRMGYNKRKQTAGEIDFDDMQLYMYMLLVQQKRQDVIAYCQNMWTDFYVDEAQDISKIQFEILRAMITDPKHLVFIGDDDQCLIEGTQVLTSSGYKNIEDITLYDTVISGFGSKQVKECTIDGVHKKHVDTDIVTLKTRGGYSLQATGDHLGFTRNAFDLEINKSDKVFEQVMFTQEKGNNTLDCTVTTNCAELNTSSILDCALVTKSTKSCTNNMLLSNAYEQLVKHISVDYADKGIKVIRKAKLTDEEYTFTRVEDFKVGMFIPVLHNGEIVEDEVVSIHNEHYTGYVYDISVPETRNFIANGIVVHNCIYQWRGAFPDIILNICGYYDIEKFVLSTNYRCKSEIVNHAARGVVHNGRRAEKSMKAHTEGGEIKICDTGNSDAFKMTIPVYNYIHSLLKGGENPSNIAVLSRNNQHLSILNSMLFKDGVFCTTTPEMRMTKSSMYKDIRAVMTMAEDTYNNFIVSNTLWRICSYMSARHSKYIAEFMASTGLSLSNTLGYILTNYADRGSDIDWNGKVKIPAKADEKMEQLYGGISYESEECLILIYNSLKQPKEEDRINALLSLYLTATEFMYKSGDRSRAINGLVAYIKTLIDKNGLEDTKSFLKMSERYEDGKMDVPCDKIAMSTMHGAKGLEWKHVIILADDNLTFPSFEGINRMLNDGVPMSDITGSLDENRRLHYVAMTRAKERLAIFTNKYNMSVYTLEALGILRKEKGHDNQSIINMAINMGLPIEAVEEVEKLVFSPDSKYLLRI